MTEKTQNGNLNATELAAKLGIKNKLAIPKLTKVAINVGVGEALVNKKAIETVSKELAQITGQKPVICLAKKDISTFKLRKGEPIGVKVTLRGLRMRDFFAKLVRIVLPRIRDFRGVPLTGFDGRGGFTFGLKEQIVFPEIEYSEVEKIRGMEITFVTTGRNREQTFELLKAMGMPFCKK